MSEAAMGRTAMDTALGIGTDGQRLQTSGTPVPPLPRCRPSDQENQDTQGNRYPLAQSWKGGCGGGALGEAETEYMEKLFTFCPSPT